jgi:predicted  nucleic acid-binding Zn-ribbon protein
LAKEAQAKYSQYDTHINELNEELRERERMLARASHSLKKEIKGVREDQNTVSRYRETIKGQIYWLLGLFKTLQGETPI